MPTSRPFARAIWLVLSVACLAAMGSYVEKIWSANQPAHFSDLYARWWGAHELLLHGRDPYAPEVTHEIQTVIYGAPVQPAFPGDVAEIGGGFAYPVYTAFFFWPAVYTQFSVVKIVFGGIAFLAVILSLLFWMRASRFDAPIAQRVIIAIFLFASFPALQALKLQNMSVVAAVLIAATVAALAVEHFLVAGVLLSLATFKPQFVVVLVPWLLLWTLGDWRRRRSFVWAFLGGMAVLLGAGEAIDPGWFPRFLAITHAYQQYTYGYSLLQVWFGARVGLLLGALVFVAVLTLGWRSRFAEARSRNFYITTSLMLATTLVIIPTLAPHAQLLLVPGFLFLLSDHEGTALATRSRRLLTTAVWCLLAWPWIAAGALAVAALRYPAAYLLRWWELPLYTSPTLPLVVALVLAASWFAADQSTILQRSTSA